MAVRGATRFGRRLTRQQADAQLASARGAVDKAFQGDCALNMARPGAAMDYPISEETVAADEQLRRARRAVRRAR